MDKGVDRVMAYIEGVGIGSLDIEGKDRQGVDM